MTDRSNRYEEHNIGLHRRDFVAQIRDQFFGQPALGVDATHEGQCMGSERADGASVDHGAQRIDGKHHVWVNPSIGHVVRKMACAQVGSGHVGRNPSVGRVVLVMEGDLSGLIDATGRNKCNLGFGQRLRRAHECSRLRLMGPPVGVVAELGITVTCLLNMIDDVESERWLKGQVATLRHDIVTGCGPSGAG